MADIMAWLSANLSIILAVLLGVSEALALIPGIKSNSVFQTIWNALKAIKEAFKPKDPSI